MSKLCVRCVHRRPADQASLDQLNVRGMPPSQQAAVNRLAGELRAAQRLEELAYQRTAGGGMLGRRPLEHDWCFARSVPPDSGNYYFCDWLKEMKCSHYSGPGSAHLPKGLSENKREAKEKSVRGVQKTVSTGNTSAAGSRDGAATVQTPVSAATPGSMPAALSRAKVDQKAEWSVPLGIGYDLRTVSRPSEAGSLGAGSFSIDYEMVEVPAKPAIRDRGLAQTYLIFGGPGAGKTYYFKYLLSSLLAEPRRPGCLLLDPKGALTGWLSEVMQKLGRSSDLTVLQARASQNAFNVLSKDLAPIELGRLLSEVVLAGAAGIDPGWAVLVTDLLEAAAVVIAADKMKTLTAKTLLHDILYRSGFTYPDGRKVKEYPIVFRAKRVLKTTADPDVRIACDRIDDFFKSTEDRQRRFVRQIIERALGNLMSTDWAYLSSEQGDDSIYSGIIHNHRVVTVAVGQGSPAFQRSLSTLVKALFQQTALADLSKRSPTDEAPFYILACDEYAQAITEGETGLVSDSRFFSLSREAGCMSLLALQSVATGRSRFPASMHDRWEAILGNVTVKLFMRVNDVETAELGSALAGTQHSFVPVSSQQLSAQGLSATDAVTMLEHPRVPPWYLTNRMPQGYALVQGTLDGKSMPTSVFVRVPS
jgi:hypothetical protein